MAVYSVEGKLGTGKTKFCVWKAQEALYAGRRVASNVDLYLEHLTPYRRSTCIRLPDKPSAFDLAAIGPGNPESYDEDRNGILILDELGTWLNSRSFQDKDRAGLLDWLIHARKHGWDVYLIVQDAGMIDKQVREALIEYQCKCLRLDKVRIPYLGVILSLFNERWAYLPKLHLTTARVGYGAGAVVAERWYYQGQDLHAAYDTRQIFQSSYPHGVHSVLLPHDFVPKKTWVVLVKEKYKYAFSNLGAFVAGLAICLAVQYFWPQSKVEDTHAVVNLSSLQVAGLVRFEQFAQLSLSDGSSVRVRMADVVRDAKGARVKVNDAWIYVRGI